MSWPSAARQIAAALRLTGLGGLLRRAGLWRGALALAYHRIGDGSDSPFDRGLYSATAEDFDLQIRFLKKHCDVIGPDVLGEALRNRRGRYALITFDDGYRDNFEQAFPILKSHRVPGVFFVSTGFMDQPRLSWWDEIAWMVRQTKRPSVPRGSWLAQDVELRGPDREQPIRSLLRTYKSLPGHRTGAYLQYLGEVTGCGRFGGAVTDTWMTWDMIRQMRAGGMFIGGHTVNHPVLARLPREEQWCEIDGCGQRLRRELGEPMRWFSYPVGGPDAFNEETRGCLREQGVEIAFSYRGTYRPFRARFDADQDAVPRAAVERSTTLTDLGAVLALPQVLSWSCDGNNLIRLCPAHGCEA